MSSRKRSGGGSGHKSQQTMTAAFNSSSYTKIKEADLFTFVEKELSVPGSFWPDCEETDLETLYMVKVVAHTGKHKFQGMGSSVAAVRVEVQGSAAALVDNENIWIGLDLFSKFWSAEVERVRAKDALERSAALANGDLIEAEDGGACPDLVEVDADEAPSHVHGPGSRGGHFIEHFHPPRHARTVMRKSRRKSGEQVEVLVYVYTCKHCDKDVTQEGSGSGALSGHCRLHHPLIYKEICEVSSHTKFQMRDGEMIEIYTFDEAFGKHVTYCVESYLDYLPLWRSRKQGCRTHSTSLDARYTPPHPSIAERIIMIIDELMMEELQKLINQQRAQVGGTIVGEQSDAMTKHGVSYIVLNGSMVLFRNGRFSIAKFLLDYGEFTLGPHTAKNMAAWWQGVHVKFGINPLVDIGTPTIDGASNGKAAARFVFKKPPAARGAAGRPNAPRICAGHQIQRAIAYATGKPGARKTVRRRRSSSFSAVPRRHFAARLPSRPRCTRRNATCSELPRDPRRR